MYYIYKFYDKNNNLLYVGKTINLNQRFTSHFLENNWKPKETKKIMFAECKTKTDMDIYEIYYINKLKPKYNISLVNNDEPVVKLLDLEFNDYIDMIYNDKPNKIQHKNELSIIEKRILNICIEHFVSQSNIELEKLINNYCYTIRINVKDYMIKYNITSARSYSDFEIAVENLKNKYITYNNKRINYVRFGYYDFKRGSITLLFQQDNIMYLLNNKDNFYCVNPDINLKNKYSILLYSLVKKYEKNKFKIFSLEDLKFKLGIKDYEYEKYSSFKQNVINPSIKNINGITDLKIKIEEIKDKRKVTKIKFII